MNPTPAQLEVLTILHESTTANNVAPTLRELADLLGVTSVSVHERLHGARLRGLCRRTKHRSRTWQLTAKGRRLVTNPLLTAADDVCKLLNSTDTRLEPNERHALRRLKQAVQRCHRKGCT